MLPPRYQPSVARTSTETLNLDAGTLSTHRGGAATTINFHSRRIDSSPQETHIWSQIIINGCVTFQSSNPGSERDAIISYSSYFTSACLWRGKASAAKKAAGRLSMQSAKVSSLSWKTEIKIKKHLKVKLCPCYLISLIYDFLKKKIQLFLFNNKMSCDYVTVIKWGLQRRRTLNYV